MFWDNEILASGNSVVRVLSDHMEKEKEKGEWARQGHGEGVASRWRVGMIVRFRLRDSLIDSLTKHTPQFRVIMHVARIQVVPDGALEQGGVLGNDGQSTSEIKQADR